jgi:hypothetical protein
MQTNLEQAIEIIRALPVEDYGKLREVIDEEERAKQSQVEKKIKLARDIERYKKTEKWLAENREKYMNQWVCLYGDELIAHGTDALEVDRQAKEKGIEAPFLEHIVEEKYPFGGW